MRIEGQGPDVLGVLFGRVLDGRADQVPPILEPGFSRSVGTGSQTWIAKQDSIERGEDLTAVGFGPGNRGAVPERAVFGVRPINRQTSNQRPGRQVATWGDVVAGEPHD